MVTFLGYNNQRHIMKCMIDQENDKQNSVENDEKIATYYQVTNFSMSACLDIGVSRNFFLQKCTKSTK